jgi:hypothetical protein
MVEGMTEGVFKNHLLDFLRARLPNGMPKVVFSQFNGRIPKGNALQKWVNLYLTDRPTPADYVIALTDVYTGTDDFDDAADARKKMRDWVGDPRFYAHAAQYDFEAWLLPYWDEIQRKSGSNRACPGTHPELVNHRNPPSKRIDEAFRTGRGKRCYVKTKDALSILRGKDLLVSARACPELKAFLNTLLRLAGGDEIP